MENGPQLLAGLLTGLQGQGRAPNTINLRKAYTDYAVNERSSGNAPLSFEEWAKTNYPDMPIIGQ